MKVFLILSLSILFLQCKKEEKLSAGITFQFDKSVPMKYQEFNEGLDEYNGSVIYIGHMPKTVFIKYYSKGIMIPPPPSPIKNNFQEKKYKQNERKYDLMKQKYFNGYLPVFISQKDIKKDSIGNHNIRIEANTQDTIPYYSIPFNNYQIKAYKSFPVYIKNISTHNLILPVGLFGLSYEVLNKSNKWQILYNNNWFICGTGSFPKRYYSFKKEDMIIFGVPYLKGNFKTKMRIRFEYAISNEFEASVDSEIFKRQR
ncbi:hypothetical protein HZQ67_09680 [Elizabethkingia anophelis]|nr:hypothetical protein FF18_05785 [Elizabethkingia anophelis]MCT3787636.1 hypothetical protein [Elizabethkingia anophelis]MDV3501313.1 hypothetical protein [Elizabethkingia anophelis]